MSTETDTRVKMPEKLVVQNDGDGPRLAFEFTGFRDPSVKELEEVIRRYNAYEAMRDALESIVDPFWDQAPGSVEPPGLSAQGSLIRANEIAREALSLIDIDPKE